MCPMRGASGWSASEFGWVQASYSGCRQTGSGGQTGRSLLLQFQLQLLLSCQAGVLLRAELNQTGCDTCSSSTSCTFQSTFRPSNKLHREWGSSIQSVCQADVRSAAGHAFSPDCVSELRVVYFSAGSFQIMPPCQSCQLWVRAVGPVMLQTQCGDRGEMRRWRRDGVLEAFARQPVLFHGRLIPQRCCYSKEAGCLIYGFSPWVVMQRIRSGL